MRLAELKSGGDQSASATAVDTQAPVPSGTRSLEEDTGVSSFSPGEPSPSETCDGVTAITPSGIEVYYQSQPKRLYRLRKNDYPEAHRREGLPWIEIPSVTTVLDVLDSSGPLIWWGQKTGVAGALQRWLSWDESMPLPAYQGLGSDDPAVQEIVDWMTEQEITTNHTRDKAADRGTNVHKALERWCETGVLPDPDAFPDHERGYVVGLVAYIEAIQGSIDFDSIQSEIMVGSLEHRFAGRYDLRIPFTKPCELVVRIYPKRKPKIEEIPAGMYLKDAKTSSGVYDKHFLQVEGYEGASVECGYESTNYRAIVHLSDDGRYEVVLNGATSHGEAKKQWTYEDFLIVRKCYAVMKERESLKSEREVEQALREELGATEVT